MAAAAAAAAALLPVLIVLLLLWWWWWSGPLVVAEPAAAAPVAAIRVAADDSSGRPLTAFERLMTAPLPLGPATGRPVWWCCIIRLMRNLTKKQTTETLKSQRRHFFRRINPICKCAERIGTPVRSLWKCTLQWRPGMITPGSLYTLTNSSYWLSWLLLLSSSLSPPPTSPLLLHHFPLFFLASGWV